MGSEERRAAERQVEARAHDVIVATSAFGMGMDYAHLEWALLWQAPPSLLALAQAIGRVGRDPSRGGRAICFWDEDDFRLIEWCASGSQRRKAQLALVREFLGSAGCRRSALRRYFELGALAAAAGSEAEERSCQRCDACRR
jgi:ATP-dependent DNA helicase RecQ